MTEICHGNYFEKSQILNLQRPGMLFGVMCVSIWYWCIDQEMTQRVLSAKSLPNAQLGCAMAALFKSIPAFITGNFDILDSR